MTIDHPSYYNVNGTETIKEMEIYLYPEEIIGGVKFNIFKYVSRYKHKHSFNIFGITIRNKKKELEDLKKALWYTNYAISLRDKKYHITRHFTGAEKMIFNCLIINDFEGIKKELENIIRTY